jgi:hypothetical protein
VQCASLRPAHMFKRQCTPVCNKCAAKSKALPVAGTVARKYLHRPCVLRKITPAEYKANANSMSEMKQTLPGRSEPPSPGRAYEDAGRDCIRARRNAARFGSKLDVLVEQQREQPSRTPTPAAGREKTGGHLESFRPTDARASRSRSELNGNFLSKNVTREEQIPTKKRTPQAERQKRYRERCRARERALSNEVWRLRYELKALKEQLQVDTAPARVS